MINILKVRHEERQLVMDRTFAKNAENCASEEYNLLQRARHDYPTYAVVTRKIKRNSNKKTYKGLNYEYMEDYIMSHGSAETIKKNLREFDEMHLISKCHGKAFRYPFIKSWFLEKYPEIVSFGTSQIGQIIEIGEAPECKKSEEKNLGSIVNL